MSSNPGQWQWYGTGSDSTIGGDHWIRQLQEQIKSTPINQWKNPYSNSTTYGEKIEIVAIRAGTGSEAFDKALAVLRTIGIGLERNREHLNRYPLSDIADECIEMLNCMLGVDLRNLKE